MRGSLDDPPIVIRSARRPALLALAAALLAFAAAWYAPYGAAHPPEAVLWAGRAIMGVVVLLCAVAVLRRPAIEISAEGVRTAGLVRRFHAWREIEGFRPISGHFRFGRWGVYYLPKSIGVTLAGGRSATLNSTLWTIPHDDLLALLAAARKRWSACS